jgi:paraquat-inducible protein B
MTDPKPSHPEIQGPKRFRPRLSAAWLVPLLALALSLSVAWRSYRDRGPIIEIVFESASGISPGETQLRFRNIVVGTVEGVDFTPDLSEVVAEVRLDRQIAPFVDDSAQFWLVSAQVGPRGVTGLSTVLSGAYIEGQWDADTGPRQSRYVALDRPPLTAMDEPGIHLRIRAQDGGSLAVGAPILFKQIPVGTIEAVDLTDAGDVVLSAFVEAPHDQRLTTGTRFWNVSGFSVELGSGGAELRVDSLAALVQGGIAFETVVSGGQPAVENQTFSLYPSESAARSGVLSAADAGMPVTVSAAFDGSVEGLQAGADVRLHGIPVGEVTALQARVENGPEGPRVQLETTLAILPGRLGIGEDGDPAAATLDLLEAGVERGLRAQLSRTGLISSTLFVDLVEVSDAPPGNFERDAEPHPRLPTVAPEQADLMGSAEGLMERISTLPVEEIMQSVLAVLANVNALIASDEVQSVPNDVGAMVDDLRALIGSDEVQQVPTEVTAILQSVRRVIDEVAAEQVAASLAAALEEVRTATAKVGTAAEGLPAVVAEVEGLAGEVRALPLEEMVTAATEVLAGVDAFVRSDEMATIPADVDAALGDLQLILQDLREGGAAENATATLASIRRVADEVAASELTRRLDTLIDEVEVAAGQVSTASEDLPRLLDSLTELSEKANALPLDELVASGTRTLDNASLFLGNDDVEGVPPRLSAALLEFQLLLQELREGGAVANVNATLASADEAAEAITAAAARLPALVDQLSAAAARADATLGSVGPGSPLNRDTAALLNELRAAARSVDSLATALERRPNSVLFGR